MDELHRFLGVVTRELGAKEARLEVSTAEPSEGDLSLLLPSGFRLVAHFDGDAPEEGLEHLRQLAGTFAMTLDAVPQPKLLGRHNPRAALDDALDVLCGETSALAGLVIDAQSPELWGSSLEPRGEETCDDAAAIVEMRRGAGDKFWAWLGGADEEIPAAIAHRAARFRAAGYDEACWRRRGMAFDALVHAREEMADTSRTRGVRHDESGPYLSRSFGGVYRLVMVFRTPTFSELHAEAAMIHALPWIEKLTRSLPPVDPGGGRVLKMRTLRPV